MDVWTALEAPRNIELRSTLTIVISQYVDNLGVSQTEAAKRLGITQPRLSDLMAGKIDKFSLDSLVQIAEAAGFSVKLEVLD